jgi:hypothetical protein
MLLFSHRFIGFLSVLVFLLILFIPVVGQHLKTDPAAKLLPDKLGDFRASGRIDLQKTQLPGQADRSFGIEWAAGKTYVSKDGGRYSVSVIEKASDAAAYAELTHVRNKVDEARLEAAGADVGTAGVSFLNAGAKNLVFFKGRVLVAVCEDQPRDSPALLNLARRLAETLDKGAGEVPVLVKHLPDWENVQRQVIYAVSRDTLKNAFANQPVWDAVSFSGGAEAVVANYGSQKMAIVEFNTASLATDNDQSIKAKLEELRAQGQPTPTAYRRVGNYAVFVFDASSVEAANQLIDQVKYQQVVQWLGENPYSYERATREFTETTLGVLVAVVKTSGLALVACFAVGGFFGALLFRLRRTQQRAREAYVDADAMLRLNLDELTPESEPARLLGPEN